MVRQWAAAVLAGAVLAAAVAAAEEPKDTQAAEQTRTKKLKGKVTVEAKMQPFKEILKDISEQLYDQKLGPIATEYEQGVSGNTRTSLNVKDVTAEEALDKLFGSLELGYIVVSKKGDAHDGYLRIVKGNARGYAAGSEPKDAPKPADPKKPDPKPDAKPDPKKPDPKPEVKPDPKPDPKPDTPADPGEKEAAEKLAAAKELLDDKKTDEAKPLLKYVSKFYPKTKAGEEAKKLLDGIK